MNELCIYLEVIGIKNANTFLVYIPSKYNIKAKDRENTFEISYINVNDDGTIVGEYANDPDDFDVENTYDNITIEDNKDINMVDRLEEKYKSQLNIKEKGNNKEILDIFRQLRRLRFCVQCIGYKICIMYKNYMCCISRDDKFEGYKIKEHSRDIIRRLIITTDLETLYERSSNIDSDLHMVQTGIHKILDRNQNTQANILKEMLDIKNDIISTSNIVYYKKKQYSVYLIQFRDLLYRLNNAEKIIVEKILVFNEKYDMSDSKGLHSDMEHSRILSELEDKINNINSIKQDIIHNILEIQNKRDNISLTVDKIMFDNSVMLDTIYRNFDSLRKLNIER
jgi:hypothetical protein